MSKESPEYLRTSLGAAMTLGLKKGLFYRNAKCPCINLLLTYNSGCAGNCGYCGLSMKRPGGYKDKSFIRVEWPVYKLTDIMEKITWGLAIALVILTLSTDFFITEPGQEGIISPNVDRAQERTVLPGVQPELEDLLDDTSTDSSQAQ